jgi:glutamine---fructose-6-phosphate transaminase (isomerizing)
MRGVSASRAIAATTLTMPNMAPFVTPLVYAIVIQLIAYHAAVFRGTDVDQPRNLAKSVTVE